MSFQGTHPLTSPVTRLIHTGTDGVHGVHLFGDARLAGEGILLTSGTSQTSAAFTAKPVLQDKSFRCSVTFRLTSPGSGEADGIAVVFSPERKLGLGGYGLGYSGLGGKGDFAVESESGEDVALPARCASSCSSCSSSSSSVYLYSLSSLSLALLTCPPPHPVSPSSLGLPLPLRHEPRTKMRKSLTRASRHLPHTGLCRRPAYPAHISPLASSRASPPLHCVHQSPHDPILERRARLLARAALSRPAEESLGIAEDPQGWGSRVRGDGALRGEDPKWGGAGMVCRRDGQLRRTLAEGE